MPGPGLNDEQRLSLMKHHYGVKPLPLNRDRIAAADSAATVLGREMALSGLTPEAAAQRSGVHVTSIVVIAAGKRKPENYERAGLERVFGLDADVLAAKNTVANRSAVNAAKPLI